MGIFSDMETGTKIFLAVIAIALVYFGGKNVFHDDNKGGKGGGSSSSGGSSGGSAS